eukprot:6378907-Karenia_brevis.AAC.1
MAVSPWAFGIAWFNRYRTFVKEQQGGCGVMLPLLAQACKDRSRGIWWIHCKSGTAQPTQLIHPSHSHIDGGSGPPDSPIGTDVEDNGSQYGAQHGSGADDSGEGQLNDQMMKVVTAT